MVKHMHEYYAQENGKIYYAIVTRRKGERRNTNKRSIQISDNQPIIFASSSCNVRPTANV